MACLAVAMDTQQEQQQSPPSVHIDNSTQRNPRELATNHRSNLGEKRQQIFIGDNIISAYRKAMLTAYTEVDPIGSSWTTTLHEEQNGQPAITLMTCMDPKDQRVTQQSSENSELLCDHNSSRDTTMALENLRDEL